ncbi:TIM barrel protein [Candidatus Woesearchaeota archaeon]|nr:TIM barrel protein [Candidatus Woesearchaeota archaeon]
MDDLLFGTAGIPIGAKGEGTGKGIDSVKRLGLGAMELEFVQSVNISEKAAPIIASAAEKSKVVLTCHAPYFVNLNAEKMKVLEASRARLLKSAQIASACGAWSVCFHSAFYLGMDKEDAYKNVKKQLSLVMGALEQQGIDIWMRPETMGKKTQFGRLSEILKLSSELDRVMPCVDFAHMHALEGKNNTYDEFCGILEEVEKALGKQGLANMHIHFSGINYGPKGERNHLVLEESDFNYEELVRAFRDFKIKGVAISESPNIEEDALLLQKIYNRVAQK